MENETIWQKWVENLHRWRLHSFAIWFFDSSKPLHLVGAQLLYIGQPFLNGLIPNGQIRALTSVLEDPAQAQTFASFLREAQ